ncbi:MAG: efflux RND transporter periplasmic adaptor subunit [Lachnospiraceae bacterium]|nr:efflux RND transporter periplasmic adaptor subunit [Lachnospiraceae bacterium]
MFGKKKGPQDAAEIILETSEGSVEKNNKQKKLFGKNKPENFKQDTETKKKKFSLSFHKSKNQGLGDMAQEGKESSKKKFSLPLFKNRKNDLGDIKKEETRKIRFHLPFQKNRALDMENSEKKPRKKWSKKKKIWASLAAVLVLCIVVISVIQANMPEPLETVTIATVQLRDIEETIDTSGYVQSSYEKTYFSPVSAVIEECNVTAGTMVQEGQILATFNSEELELAAKQAELTDKAAQSGYENTLQTGNSSESKLDSLEDKIEEYEKLVEETEESITSINSTLKSYNQELNQINSSGAEISAVALQRKAVLESGIYSFQQQLEDAQSDLSKYNTKLAEYQSEKASAEAAKLSDETKEQIEAEKELSQLNKDMADRKLEAAQAGIVAEFEGLVTDVQAVKGSMAAEGGALLTVADLNSVKVVVNLTKHNLESVEEGQMADVTIAGEEYAGEVRRISRQAVVNQSGTPVITAEIAVEETEGNTYLGIEASVAIHTASAVAAVSIPAKALNTGIDGDFCYVVDNGFVEKRDVVIGANDGEYIEILEGLEEDEEVITIVTPNIEDGMEVYTSYDEEFEDYEEEDSDEDWEDSDEDREDSDEDWENSDEDREDSDEDWEDTDGEGDNNEDLEDFDEEEDTNEDSHEEEESDENGEDVEEQDDLGSDEEETSDETEEDALHLEKSQEGDYGV